jgi:glycosyltransferase involved in cell wall biosynthesis
VETTLPVTAIVASHNEGKLLARCLEALTFCDEMIVIDIASSDDTVAVAEHFSAEVLHHAWVPIAEEAREEAIARARNDWLLLRDPDEIVPEALRAQVVALFPTFAPDVGLVTAPELRYFAGRALRGTVWGGVQADRLLSRRDLVEFPSAVHGRLVRRPGCREVEIAFTGENAIEHYWVSGYRSLVEKHVRYLRLEGAARADAGQITGPRAVLSTPWREFNDSFVRRNGYLDGVRGFLLSIVWSAYRTGAQIALLRELRRRRAR